MRRIYAYQSHNTVNILGEYVCFAFEGCALVAYKILQELAKVAETLAESELVADLKENAE